MQLCANTICEFLQSKCLVATERALRAELELTFQRSVANEGSIIRRNLWHSQLERMLNVKVPKPGDVDAGTVDSSSLDLVLERRPRRPRGRTLRYGLRRCRCGGAARPDVELYSA